ncbi:MAG: VWA domain-containing protein [Armatimonadota bacterium]|nr:VWA domain-containing protein [Armatimonadota bacterium]MDR7404681.1 VWA domain-containing protein [Armatimonadota bacterium]
MEFGWPVMLWGLLAAPALLAAYLRAQRLRGRAEAALADPHLLGALWQRPPAVRRHLPAGCYLAAVALLTFAMARPSATVPLPTNRAALVLAVDVSKSMIGEDVRPNRLQAAQRAALEVLQAVPGSARVGLIAFSDYAQVLVPPTTDRQAVQEALAGLKVLQATGVGGAIVEALRILPGRAEALGDRLAALAQPFGPRPQPPPAAAPAPSDLPPAAVVILSDGVSNLGVDPAVAARLARDAHVKIYAVGVGTPGGSVMEVDGQLVLVPFDPTLLQQIAQLTGGRYLEVTQQDELRQAARQLGRAIGWERRRTEITSPLAGLAGLLILTGASLSLLWFRRVP